MSNLTQSEKPSNAWPTKPHGNPHWRNSGIILCKLCVQLYHGFHFCHKVEKENTDDESACQVQSVGSIKALGDGWFSSDSTHLDLDPAPGRRSRELKGLTCPQVTAHPHCPQKSSLLPKGEEIQKTHNSTLPSECNAFFSEHCDGTTRMWVGSFHLCHHSDHSFFHRVNSHCMLD